MAAAWSLSLRHIGCGFVPRGCVELGGNALSAGAQFPWQQRVPWEREATPTQSCLCLISETGRMLRVATAVPGRRVCCCCGIAGCHSITGVSYPRHEVAIIVQERPDCHQRGIAQVPHTISRALGHWHFKASLCEGCQACCHSRPAVSAVAQPPFLSAR